MNVSCEDLELNSMNKFEVKFNCCLLYTYGVPLLQIHGNYDGEESVILEHNSGSGTNLYSSVSTVRIINSTQIWCNITDHSTIPPTITTCKHHVFTNNCQDQGNNNNVYLIWLL